MDLNKDRDLLFRRSGGREFKNLGVEQLKALETRQKEGGVRWREGTQYYFVYNNISLEIL